MGALAIDPEAGPWKPGMKRYGSRPPPSRPMLIPALPARPVAFADLAALARCLHRRRDGGGLQIGPLQYATHQGTATFPGFDVFRLDPIDGSPRWLGLVAIQSVSDAPLRRALQAIAPQARDLMGAA